MSRETFLKFLPSFARSFVERDREKQEPAPSRDWAVLVALFLFAACVLAGVSIFIFREMSASDITALETEEVTSRDMFSESALEEALSVYAEKERRLSALKGEKPDIADPSL